MLFSAIFFPLPACDSFLSALVFYFMIPSPYILSFFFLNDTAPPEFYPFPLPDALRISTGPIMPALSLICCDRLRTRWACRPPRPLYAIHTRHHPPPRLPAEVPPRPACQPRVALRGAPHRRQGGGLPDGAGAAGAPRAGQDRRGGKHPRPGAQRRQPGRSEERRVGKECRSRWSPY